MTKWKRKLFTTKGFKFVIAKLNIHNRCYHMVSFTWGNAFLPSATIYKYTHFFVVFQLYHI